MGEPEAQSSQFKILLATEDDFATLAEVEAVSNTSAINTSLESNASYLMFGMPNDECIQNRAKGLKKMLQDDPAIVNYKAVVVDDQGQEKIVSWAQWGFYTEEKGIKDYVDLEWPPSANATACNDLIRLFSAMRQKYMSGKKHAFLQVLATLPEYRCRGIGSAMLKQGIADAKEKHLGDFYLNASADGRPLYAKYGFRDIERLESDLTKYGGVGDLNVYAMRRVD